jgi:hypothetical protein
MAHAHLVGSFPAETAEEVFGLAATTLGDELRRCPDGETGERANWMAFQLDVLSRIDGIEISEQEVVSEYIQFPQLRFAKPVSELALDDLGYHRHAVASYETYLRLKSEGVLPAGLRFQVCFPTPLAVVGGYVSPSDQEAFYPHYEAAVLAEVARICADIPHSDLALQWDVAVETAMLEGTMPYWRDDVALFEIFADQLARIGDAIPAAVELGYHFCYGNYEGHHFKEPQDLALLVRLANMLEARLHREVEFIHVPVPVDRSDAAYFAALGDLGFIGTELYIGAVHLDDGVEGTQRRLDAARAAAGPDRWLGVGAECGFSAVASDCVPELLRIHQAVTTGNR